MKGWVGLVGWPTADIWPTKWSSVQLAVRRRSGKVRRSKTSISTTVLHRQLCANYVLVIIIVITQCLGAWYLGCVRSMNDNESYTSFVQSTESNKKIISKLTAPLYPHRTLWRYTNVVLLLLLKTESVWLLSLKLHYNHHQVRLLHNVNRTVKPRWDWQVSVASFLHQENCPPGVKGVSGAKNWQE